MKRKLIWIAPLAVLGLIAFTALGAVIVMLLWNWLAPSLFAWRPIGFFQAFGLLLLCRILFGGLGWRGMGGGSSGLRRKIDERCGSLSPEERERFREYLRRRMGERFGFEPPPPDTTKA